MRGLRIPRAGARRKRRKTIAGEVSAGALLVVCVAAAFPVMGADAGRGPPTDTGPPAVSAPPALSSRGVKPEAGPVASPPTPASVPAATGAPAELAESPWHQSLLRERQTEIRLLTARRDLDSGRIVAGLAELQSIIDRRDDLFVRLESEPVPRGARFLAESTIGSLSAEGRAAYETLVGPEARRVLNSALARNEPDLLIEVVRRFYHTAAGFEAGNRLAGRWTDHGCDDLAWGWWRRVLAEPAQRDRVRPIHRMAAACCARRLQLLGSAREILEDIGSERVMIGGRTQPAQDWLTQISKSLEETATAADSPVALGWSDRNGAQTGSPPALRQRLWQSSLAGEKSRPLAALAAAWQRFQTQNGLPVGTSQFPVLVGQTLVYRDFESLRALDVRSGAPLWSYACASAPSHDIGPQQIAPIDGNPDPNNVMRTIVGNCLLGTLAADQRHVYAIDQIETEEPAPGMVKAGARTAPPADDTAATHRQSNALLAIELAPPAPTGSGVGLLPGVARLPGKATPKWVLGGSEDDSSARRPLAGHFFLGPPLPVADRLFAVSEKNQQIFLSCLSPEAGRVLWSQAVGSISQPISVDHQRWALVCSPSYSQGIVLCPTQAGVLVAVDALSGGLLWAASCEDSEPQQKQQLSGWPYSARRRYGHPGYLNVPLIAGASVVYLPAHSECVHCLDLATGRVRWRAGREDLEPATAIEYVAAVTGQTVLVVGRRRCRGLSLRTGAEQWSARLSSAPAGRGVRLANRYHVPLDDGTLVSLELDSGRTCGMTPAAGGARLGNLVAGAGTIVSLGVDQVAVYEQAQPLSDRLESELAKAAAPKPAQLLEAAELDMILGSFDRAAARLLEVAGRSPSGPEADRTGALLRELAAGVRMCDRPVQDVVPESVFIRMAEIAGGRERGPSLLERSRAAIDRGDTLAALAAARELSRLASDVMVAAPGDPARQSAPDVAAAGLARLATFRGPHPPDIEQRWTAEIDDFVERRDADAARRLVRTYGDRGTTDEQRLKLADLLWSEGRIQQAETVLLGCRESSDATCAGAAIRRLAQLWEARGLDHAAGLLLAELASQFAQANVAPGQTGAQWLGALPRESRAAAAYRELAPPVWTGAGVKVVEQRIGDEALQSIYSGNGVQYLATPRQLAFDLFDKGRGSSALLHVVDRRRGIDYQETIQIPGRWFYPVSPQPGYLQSAFVGNFLPVGGTGALHGISLLERRLLWTSVPHGLEDSKDVVRVGPAGPEFCVFQNRQHLFVLDPLDGRVLWQRNDIEPGAGLMGGDPALGIIGDERVLVVFASNGVNYTTYDTASGAELRRGKLDVQPRMARRALGRRLFHYTAAAETRRVRVWDALSDRMLWDEPAEIIVEASIFEGVMPGTKVAQFVRDTEEVAFVTSSGQIRVVDLVEGRQRFEFSIGRELLENLSGVRAFRDRDHYFFALQHAAPPGPLVSAPGNFIADAAIPCVHIQGHLCAFDRKTQRSLWQRPLGNRSILYLPDYPLPVLVSLCRVRRQDQACLDVEVLDIQTGETLARRDDLLSDRLLLASYDRQAGVVALRGAKTVIRLEFPIEGARVSAGELAR